MRNRRTTLRLAFAFLLSLSMVGAPHVAAQPQDFDPGFYTSVLTGVEIEVSGPTFEIFEAELQHYPDGQGEIVQIASNTAPSNLEVSFFDDSDTPNGTIDIYLSSLENAADDFELLDRGTSGDYVYAIALVDYAELEIVYYVQVFEDLVGTVDLFEAILAPTVDFEIDLMAAQAEVTVDGFSFMENVSAEEVSAIVAEGGTGVDSTIATPDDPAETVDFVQSSASVGIGPDFSVTADAMVEDGVESIQIDGPNTRSMIAVGETGSDPAEVIASYADGITEVHADTDVVHEEVGAESGWSLLWVPKNGGEASFTLIVVDSAALPGYELLHAHELPTDSVAGSIVTIRDQVTINGESIMSGIDPEEVDSHAEQFLATGLEADPPASVDEATPEPAEEETSRTTNPRDAARLPDTENDEDEGGNTSETSGTAPSGEPVEGVLTESSWEGGVYGHLIEWDDAAWFVDVEYPGDLVSSTETQEDTIILQSDSAAGTVMLFISVFGETTVTPDDYLDYWTSLEHIAELGEFDAEILDSRTRGGNSAVMIRYSVGVDSEYLMILQAVQIDDSTIMIVTYDAPIENAVEMYETTRADVAFDGEPVLRVFTTSQVENAVGDN